MKIHPGPKTRQSSVAPSDEKIVAPLDNSIAARYERARALSERLADPLSAEDQGVQSMPDASPTKWHLAHASWFFETVVLAKFLQGYRIFNPEYARLFNSYYESLGPRHPRAKRGLLARPPLGDVLAYRRHVDSAMRILFAKCDPEIDRLAEIGVNHEQQHQELILTDIKHAFFSNPLLPVYARNPLEPLEKPAPLSWREHPGGAARIGHRGNGFAFDNEGPEHDVLLRPFSAASRPIACGEYLDFIEDGGYERPEFWLSDGWALARAEGWEAPLYWIREGDSWLEFTLHGTRRVDRNSPVVHVSFYEAAAYAAWANARLPTEFEWEASASAEAASGGFLDFSRFHPGGGSSGARMMGDAWQWTRSSYDPYPGYKPFDGALAEYNGKFMVGQMVLRGGSCATAPEHIRKTYRNFFPPSARWQFSGIRLAKDL